MTTMTKVVVFTISDRPEYLKNTLATWLAVRGTEDWLFEFYLEPISQTEENLRLILDFQKEADAHVMTVLNKRRLGVLSNPCRAMKGAFEDGADFAFLAEEDVMVSTDILEYASWCAERWKDDPTVFGVAASTHAEGPQEAVYLAQDFGPLGWGTWSDRWPEMERTWDHDYSSGVHPNTGWDWNMKHKVMKDRRFAFPRTSRTVHIGRHGTHMLPQDFDASVSQSWVHHRPPVTYHEETA